MELADSAYSTLAALRFLIATTGKMPVGPTAKMDCATSRPGDEAELVVLLQMGSLGLFRT